MLHEVWSLVMSDLCDDAGWPLPELERSSRPLSICHALGREALLRPAATSLLKDEARTAI